MSRERAKQTEYSDAAADRDQCPRLRRRYSNGKKTPFPSLERVDSGARRRGRKLKGVSIVSVNILMTQALPTVCTAPSLVQTACSALIIWLSIQREDSRRLVLLPFFLLQRDNTDGQPGR